MVHCLYFALKSLFLYKYHSKNVVYLKNVCPICCLFFSHCIDSFLVFYKICFIRLSFAPSGGRAGLLWIQAHDLSRFQPRGNGPGSPRASKLSVGQLRSRDQPQSLYPWTHDGSDWPGSCVSLGTRGRIKPAQTTWPERGKRERTEGRGRANGCCVEIGKPSRCSEPRPLLCQMLEAIGLIYIYFMVLRNVYLHYLFVKRSFHKLCCCFKFPMKYVFKYHGITLSKVILFSHTVLYTS